MFGSGWGNGNHVVPFQNSLMAAHLKGIRKGTLIDALFGLKKMIYADVF